MVENVAEAKPTLTAGQLAKHLGAKVIGDAERVIHGVGPIDRAQPGELTFVAKAEFAAHVPTTAAAAVLLATPQETATCVQLVHPDPYYAFARAAQLLAPAPWRPERSYAGVEIHPSATVDPSAVLFPGVFIGPGARVGARTLLYPHVYIGPEAVIGAACTLKAGCVVEARCRVGDRVWMDAHCVVGGEGFGYAPGADGNAKIPQVGIAVLEDDVEMGAMCCVDRAAMGETRVGRGTKLDAMVQIAHNVTVGEHCLFSGGSGVAGSAKIGNRVMVGGHGVINGHITVGDGVQVGAFSALTKSTAEAGQYIGFPAQPAAKWRREGALVRRLRQNEERLRRLEAALAAQTSP